MSSLKFAIVNKEEWTNNPTHAWKEIQDNSIFWCRAFKMPMRNMGSSSALVNKQNPIPWSQVVASHTRLEDVVRPV